MSDPDPLYLDDKHGIQAFDDNLRSHARNGFAIETGCEVVVEDGTLDPDTTVSDPDDTLRIEAGYVFVNGAGHQLSQQFLNLGAAHDEHPRWDLVYVTPTGSVAVKEGEPEPDRPTGVAEANPQGVKRPSPPDLSALDHDSATPLALIWIPAEAEIIDTSNRFDRRMPADLVADEAHFSAGGARHHIESGEDVTLWAGHSEVVKGPLEVDGRLEINGRLEIL